jgi:protein TonB
MAAGAASASLQREAQPAPGNTLPAYPASAREDGLEGLVQLAVELDATGQVLAVRWLARSGVPVLDAAARDAVRQWRFLPAWRGGEAVPASLRVALRFRLDTPAAAQWTASLALPASPP